MKKLIIILSILSIGILIVTPALAYDYEDPDPIPPEPTPSDSTFTPPDSQSTGLNIPNPLGGTSDITTLVKNILNFLLKIAWVIAPILIVYAGFLYITSAGNDEKVKTAQKTLIWALVGFAVVLIASSVPAIIQEFLSGESTATTTPDLIIDQDPEYTPSPGLPPISTSGTYKDCEFYLSTGTSACVTKTWSGIENKPDGNFCENDSFCQKFIYKVCRINIETGAPFCKASVWYGSNPKPDNECEDNSGCQPTP